MTPERWAEVERVYAAVRELPSSDRSRFLDDACCGDVELRAEVESLLAYESRAGAFLETPAIQHAARFTPAGDHPTARPLPSVPGYVVLRLLGEGGMGVVYLAEQQAPLRRLVALKLIRAGMDSKHILARFDLEREVLARMDHPGIAAVHDAGTAPDGRPFFVMEYVDGEPVTDFCDRRRLPARARLELFQTICDAVQHAHQKGVLHRDLKPSNVLVVEHEGRPVPKVIDFGTAKAIGDTWRDRPEFTEAGMAVGTLEYMSPEQAALSTDIDTASDVYSLGVLLYELLVGDVPIDGSRVRQAGYDEMRRLIRDSDPPRPSARLRESGSRRASIAEARGTDSDRLERLLAGDVDWIVLRALEKDRRRRYATVAALSDDIARHLSDQPVQARPVSATYRVRKFARRHRGTVMAAVTIAAVLTGGFGTSFVLYLIAERETLEANRQRDRAENQNYLLTISAADAEIQNKQTFPARQRLAGVWAARRGWEWHHLMLRTDDSLFSVSDWTSCFDSSAGESLVESSDGTNLYLKRCARLNTWNTVTYAHSAQSVAIERSVDRVVVSTEAKVLAVTGAGMSVVRERRLDHTWELQLRRRLAGAPDRVLGPFERRPACATVSLRGDRLAVGMDPTNYGTMEHQEDVFEVWNTASGERLRRLRPPRSINYDTRSLDGTSCMVRFTPDGSLLATSGAHVHLWDTESGSPRRADRGQAGVVTQPIAFSPDGRALAIGRRNGLIDILSLGPDGGITSLDGGGHIEPLPMSEVERRQIVPTRSFEETRAVEFFPDGKSLLSGFSMRVGVWDLAARKLTKVLDGHETNITGVVVARNTGLIYSSDAAGRVRAWRIDGSNGVTRLEGGSYPSAPIAVSRDTTTIVAASSDGQVVAWLPDEGRKIQLRPPGSSALSLPYPTLLVTSDGQSVLEERGGGVFQWTLPTGKAQSISLDHPIPESPRLPDGGHLKNGASISVDDRYIAHRQGHCIVVRELPSLRAVTYLDVRLGADDPMGVPHAVQFKPDGALLIASSHYQKLGYSAATGVIRLWNWKTGRVLQTHRSDTLPAIVMQWSVSADGTRVALSGFVPNYVTIWNGDLDTEIARIAVPRIPRHALSQDGRRLATAFAANDKTVRIWDTSTQQLVLTLVDIDAHGGGVTFTSDGNLVAGRTGGGVTIWETQQRTPNPGKR